MENESLIDGHEKSLRRGDKELPSIHPINGHFRQALDKRTYQLVDKASGYDDEAAKSIV